MGIEVKKTTVKEILSKKDAIEAALKTGIPLKPKKLKSAQHLMLDDGVRLFDILEADECLEIGRFSTLAEIAEMLGNKENAIW